MSLLAGSADDPSGQVAGFDEDDPFTPEEAGELVGGLFALAADRLGDHWRLDDHEKQTLSRPLAKVLNKHWDGVGQYAEEAALALAAASILGGKLRYEMEEE